MLPGGLSRSLLLALLPSRPCMKTSRIPLGLACRRINLAMYGFEGFGVGKWLAPAEHLGLLGVGLSDGS